MVVLPDERNAQELEIENREREVGTNRGSFMRPQSKSEGRGALRLRFDPGFRVPVLLFRAQSPE
jgi:hypothetical protein